METALTVLLWCLVVGMGLGVLGFAAAIIVTILAVRE